jgi:hypothetical protein
MIVVQKLLCKIVVINIIMHKTCTTNFMVQKRTQKLCLLGLQIGLQIFFTTKQW